MELDLEQDLLLSQEDIRAMRKARSVPVDTFDLSRYLNFLEAIGAFLVPAPPIRKDFPDFEL